MSDILQLKKQYEWGVDMLERHRNGDENGFSNSELGAHLWRNLLDTLEKLEDRIRELEYKLKEKENNGDKK